MNTNFLTYYQLLDVETNATTHDIITAYKLKAKAYHPDKNNGNHTANVLFQLINQAKEVLTDSVQRLKYDYSIGVRQKPTIEPEEKIVYVKEESNSLKEILTVGAIGLATGLLISKSIKKRKKKKPRK